MLITFSLPEFLIMCISYLNIFESLIILRYLAVEHDSDTLIIQVVFHPFLSFQCYSSALSNRLYYLAFSCLLRNVSLPVGRTRGRKSTLGFCLKPLPSLAHFRTSEFYWILAVFLDIQALFPFNLEENTGFLASSFLMKNLNVASEINFQGLIWETSFF